MIRNYTDIKNILEPLGLRSAVGAFEKAQELPFVWIEDGEPIGFGADDVNYFCFPVFHLHVCTESKDSKLIKRIIKSFTDNKDFCEAGGSQFISSERMFDTIVTVY